MFFRLIYRCISFFNRQPTIKRWRPTERSSSMLYRDRNTSSVSWFNLKCVCLYFSWKTFVSVSWIKLNACLKFHWKTYVSVLWMNLNVCLYIPWKNICICILNQSKCLSIFSLKVCCAIKIQSKLFFLLDVQALYMFTFKRDIYCVMFIIGLVIIVNFTN